MKRIRRVLRVVAVSIILGAVLLGAAWRFWIRPHVAAQVVPQLEAVTGGPVQVAEVDVGLRTIALRGLKLFAAEDGAAETPWAVIDDVSVDVSSLDWLRGKDAVRHLTLRGADVTLNFDKQGRLLTQLAQGKGDAFSLPGIRLQDSRLTLRQEGRPALVLNGIEANLRAQDGQFLFDGTIADPTWGLWTFHGQLDPTSKASSLTLKTSQVHVTQAMLDAVPIVPGHVWQQVQIASADTPGEVALRFDPERRAWHYRVALTPKAATGHVAALDLSVADGNGEVVVEDGRVRLGTVRGTAAGGRFACNGDLDFTVQPLRMSFDITANGLDMNRLPKSWRLPEQIEGRLSGQADLQVTVVDGQPRFSGQGEGKITDVPLGDKTATISLKLHSDGKRFHFAQPMANAVTEPPPSESQGEGFLLGQAVNGAHRGVGQALDTAARTMTSVMSYLPKVKAPVVRIAPERSANYLEARLALEDVDLDKLVSGLGVPLPFAISGRVTFQVQVAIPFDTPRDVRTYRLQGTATLPRMTLAGMQLEEVRARVLYRDGVLRLEELVGYVPTGQPLRGSFTGTGSLGLIPEGDLQARLTLKDIPLAQVGSLLPSTFSSVTGAFSGEAEGRIPAGRLRDLTAWEATGSLTARRLGAYGLVLRDARLQAQLNRGVLSVSDLKGQLEGAPVSGSAELHLTDPYRFQAKLALPGVDLTALQRLTPEWRLPVQTAGRFEATADLEGTLSPFRFQASGTGSATDLKVDAVKLGRVQFRWQSEAKQLTLSEVQASLDGGELTGSAVFPLTAQESGTMDLRFQKLELRELTRSVPRLPLWIEGRASGSIKGTLTAARPGQERTLDADLKLDAPKLRIMPEGITAEQLQGNIRYHKQTVEYHLEGKLFGGTFRLDSPVAPEGAPQPDKKPPEQQQEQQEQPQARGRLLLEGAHLHRLWQDLGLQDNLGSLRGRVDLDIRYGYEGPDRILVGEGRLVVRRLRWDLNDLASEILSEVRLHGDELRLRNLSGVLGGGLLSGQVVVNLRQRERSWFNVHLNGAEAERLLAAWPSWAERIRGSLDVSLRGRLGQEWSGTGQIILGRGKVFGVEVSEWQMPLSFIVAPARGYGEITLRDSRAQVAQGRASAQGSWRWGVGTRLEGQIRFHGVDLRTALRQATDIGHLGGGRVSGRIDFGGNDIRSVDDVTALIDVSLQQTQALEYPVLLQLTPYLMPGGASQAVFQTGELRARLAGGVVRIQRFSLTGSLLQMVIEGTITLQGRLNLEVWANTGRLTPNPGFLRLVGLRIPTVGPIPVGLLLEAGNYLSNRLLHLRVSGTVRSPTIQVDPVVLVTEEALRYFIGWSRLPLP